MNLFDTLLSLLLEADAEPRIMTTQFGTSVMVCATTGHHRTVAHARLSLKVTKASPWVARTLCVACSVAVHEGVASGRLVRARIDKTIARGTSFRSRRYKPFPRPPSMEAVGEASR